MIYNKILLIFIVLCFTPSVVFGSEIVDLINQYRILNHEPVAVELSSMCFVNQYRMKQIQSSFNHNGFYAIKSMLKTYGEWYENLAIGYDSPKKVFNGWLKSYRHRANLLAPINYICVIEDHSYWVMEGWQLHRDTKTTK